MSEAVRQENPLPSDPIWYKDAVIYQTHVKAFFDTDGDGTGDFRGLMRKLDYIRDLGINCIWLLPFYPSPMRDDGYDISDYRNVHPAYGSRRDFRRFVQAAHRRGIRVIVELIVNHTSDRHPWFQAARKAPKGSWKRNFYVWSDDDGRFPETRIIFTDTESSNWTWDPVAGQYYWHRFFSHQPDLNHNNPRVVKAVIRVMRFWLDLGVDGLRLDAIPYLCVREGTNNENLPETHAVIKEMRAVVDAHYRDRVFLAEANQWPEDVRDYFGDGDECHMAYHFPLMPRMYMALAQEDRHPIVEIMEETPDIPPTCQWAIFLRNHDELTLEMVSDRERDYMYATYAADPRMRINVGIRRRLAPLAGNDQDKIRLLVSLLLSMPGSPILYYGDELGMGDNIYLGDRNAVRTPMQWSPDRNAGFSRADPERLYLPPVMDPVYGYPSVNVEAQTRAPASLLNWTRRVIEARKQHPVFGRGIAEFLHPGNRKVLAYVRRFAPPAQMGAATAAGQAPQGSGVEASPEEPAAAPPDEVILCVANLARTAQPVELDLSSYAGRVPIELMGKTPFPPIGELPYLLMLPSHGFYWFLLSQDAEAPAWHDERVAAVRLRTLVLPEGWRTLQPEQAERRRTALRAVALLQDEVLPAYLRVRWGCPAKELARVDIEAVEPWSDWLFALLRTMPAEGSAERLLLPLAIRWQEDGDAELPSAPSAATTLARVRRHAAPGHLFEALADAGFVQEVVAAIGAGAGIPLETGRLLLRPTSAFDRLGAESLPVPLPLRVEDIGSGIVIDERLQLRMLRCLVQDGLERTGQPAPGEGGEMEQEPMVELARYLTEVARFRNAPLLAGHVDYADADGRRCTLAVLQQFVPNQGDLAGRVTELLRRLCEEQFCGRGDGAWRDDPAQISFAALVERLGTRVAELHLALSGAAAAADAAFRPEAIDAAQVVRFRERLEAAAGGVFQRLAAARHSLSGMDQMLADALLGEREHVKPLIAALSARGLGPVRCRVHGDLDLGRVLIAEDDLVITGAGGPPGASPEVRRRKQPPLQDLGRLLRSLHEIVGTVGRTMGAEHPDSSGRLDGPLADWRREACSRLTGAYAAAAAGGASPPPDDNAWHARAAALFALETALAALGEALDGRPDRIASVAGALLSLIRDGADVA